MPKKTSESLPVKDSGKRAKFSSGAVRDVQLGKGRFDLISPFALFRLALIYEKGAVKYAPRNWEKGIPISRTLNSAIRHIVEHMMGMQDEDHLAQAAWNLIAIMHFEATMPELNDLPQYLDPEIDFDITKIDPRDGWPIKKKEKKK